MRIIANSTIRRGLCGHIRLDYIQNSSRLLTLPSKLNPILFLSRKMNSCSDKSPITPHEPNEEPNGYVEQQKQSNASPNQPLSGQKQSYPSQLRNSTAQRIGQTLHFYEDLERTLMKSINESNRRRFRVYFFGSLVVLVCVSVLFGERIRKAFTDKTAGLAKVYRTIM